MIAVIFEVLPYMGERHRYLDLAGDLRIGHIVRDYGMFERAEAPDDSKAVHAA